MARPHKGGAEATPKRRRSHDWPALRARFVAGSESLDAFAAREGIDPGTVRRQAAREGWKAQRKAAGAKVAAGTVAAVVRQRIRSEAYIDGQAHRAALKVARIGRKLLDGIDDPTKLKAAVEAIERAHRLARITAHLPEVPVSAAASDGPEGEVTIRRRRPDGSETEVTLAADAAPRGRLAGSPPDPDSVCVPVGHDEPRQGDDRRPRERQE